MELKQLKEHFESFPKGTKFNFGITKPFSWRGSYAEVAFAMIKQPTTREEILTNIELAYTKTFRGYKGGEYNYNDYTDIHFETDYGSWTDGEYTSRLIAEIEEKEEYKSQEERLVKLAFCK
jgi:hypothetical protein